MVSKDHDFCMGQHRYYYHYKHHDRLLSLQREQLLLASYAIINAIRYNPLTLLLQASTILLRLNCISRMLKP